jgi:hypothetical protein
MSRYPEAGLKRVLPALHVCTGPDPGSIPGGSTIRFRARRNFVKCMVCGGPLFGEVSKACGTCKACRQS